MRSDLALTRKRAATARWLPAIRVILTLSIDDAGRVVGLEIMTDPKARLYLKKKAYLLGTQAMSRYGADGWTCSEQPPGAD